MYELSSAGGRDHLEFLLEAMGEPRWLEPKDDGALNTGRAAAVIKLAAAQAGWGKLLPKGRALGHRIRQLALMRENLRCKKARRASGE
jgi:isoquinoline 1-oxidoreductase subunit beta